jgi:DUF1009 family protein
MTGIEAATEGLSTAPAGGRIAVIAGTGALPAAVVRQLVADGRNPFVVTLGSEAARNPVYSACDHLPMELGDLGRLMARLKQEGVDRIVLAGGVAGRPRLRDIRWSLDFFKLLPKLAAALRRGDDSLLRVLIEHLEANGIRVVGSHEIVPQLLAPEGVLTRAQPTAADQRDIAAASEAALAIGRLDIGQAAIAIGGRAVALEGIEGTDGLLERTIALRGLPRLAGGARGVLVKRCKPGQELRADLPSIGPETIEAAHRAGLVGVAVEAGRSFILDFEQSIARADAVGLFLVGLPAAEGGA